MHKGYRIKETSEVQGGCTLQSPVHHPDTSAHSGYQCATPLLCTESVECTEVQRWCCTFSSAASARSLTGKALPKSCEQQHREQTPPHMEARFSATQTLHTQSEVSSNRGAAHMEVRFSAMCLPSLYGTLRHRRSRGTEVKEGKSARKGSRAQSADPGEEGESARKGSRAQSADPG
eukprot:362375-Chlamydomonas_euryale.AAC.2